MAKYVILCPKCGKYNEAKTGFFSRKKIHCSCGFDIDTRLDKFISRECPECGNIVTFDQSKGTDAKCPVCGALINTLADQIKVVEFSCVQCGQRIKAPKGSAVYKCPICGKENDVNARVQAEKNRHSDLVSVIKYEGANDTLVWKYPIEDFKYGSQLIVHESQEALFFRDGQALDLFGAGRYTLQTHQLPLLEKLYTLPADGDQVFHSEVYYINTAVQTGIKWGTDPKISILDPSSALPIELGAYGEFNIRVTDSRKLLIKLVGTTSSLSNDQLIGNGGQGLFRALVLTRIKGQLASVIKETNLNILEIDRSLPTLSEALRDRINVQLADYGLQITEFSIIRIAPPDDDPNFRKLKEQLAERSLGVREEEVRREVAAAEAERKAVEAQAAAKMKIIEAQGNAEALKIQRAAEAEAYRLKAQAEAEEMRMKGYTYQQETSRQVGMAAIENSATTGGTISTGGGELGNFVGDIAKLGVTLGTIGSVVGMAKDALNPVIDAAGQMGKTIGSTISGTWDCTCGQRGISTNFCPICGAKRPVQGAPGSWDCPVCGKKGLSANFCPECGSKRPEPISKAEEDNENKERGPER